MRYIDLRSDTVTMPTPEMREAMRNAEVGDNVFDDDPTVGELETLAAEMLGKEAAVFVTSGTQGNAVSVMAHTRRGDAVLMGHSCHVATHENGSYAMLAGVSPIFAAEENGVLRPESVEELLSADSDIHVPEIGLLCLENALGNGRVAPVSVMERAYTSARERGVPVHLDGARLFNAATSLGVGVKEITRNCDSVMSCLSKGLGAPVGSIVAGERDFVQRAKRMRKILGGGMRQSGILAAAGIVALTSMTERLRIDHGNAQYLAKRLAELPGVEIDLDSVQINMVFFTVNWPEEIVKSLPEKMLENGIKILPGRHFRFVTHNDVALEDIDTVISVLSDIIQKV